MRPPAIQGERGALEVSSMWKPVTVGHFQIGIPLVPNDMTRYVKMATTPTSLPTTRLQIHGLLCPETLSGKL